MRGPGGWASLFSAFARQQSRDLVPGVMIMEYHPTNKHINADAEEESPGNGIIYRLGSVRITQTHAFADVEIRLC